MSESTVNVTVKLFVVYQEAYRVPELKLQFPIGATVVDVCDRLIAHPNLEQWREFTRDINLQFVEPGRFLQNQDEIVLIPPVSGG